MLKYVNLNITLSIYKYIYSLPNKNNKFYKKIILNKINKNNIF